MNEFAFGRWRITCDPNRTCRAYDAMPAGGPAGCSCCYCQNLLVAREHTYPAEALALFHRLGIDPHKEIETCNHGRLESGLHLYGGFFHFVGAIAAGADAIQPNGAVELEPMTEAFSLGFTSHVSLVQPPFAGMPLIQLEFLAQVPWVLEEPEPVE
jgi:hypothetical protein